FAFRPKLPTKSREIAATFFYGFFSVPVALGLLFYGFDKTTSLTGTLLSALSPVAIVIVGWLLLKERVTKLEKIGITIAFFGTILTVVTPLFNGHPEQIIGKLEGNGLIIISIIIDALSILLLKIAVRSRISPAALTHISFLLGFLAIIPIALLVHPWEMIVTTIARAPLAAHAGVWYMAILSGSIAYMLRNWGIKTIEIGEAAIFAYLYPIWAAPFSIFWLKERPTETFFIGAAVIAVGVFVAEYKKRKKLRVPNPHWNKPRQRR
ncbi:DMT family transporter, partial [Candidatus Gottesmanbacteria bacterium]|nr:DMT family transporter [Candidatus Gottesmanbacteria bacterium]